MPTSTRFAVAVHILAALAVNDGRVVRSEQLASSASTNPTVVRRILSMLAEAGLTSSQLGYGGGATLAKPADQITLLDVFQVVEEPNIFEMHRTPPDKNCFVGRNIQEVLTRSTAKAQQALETELSKTTIAKVAQEIQILAQMQNR
ncbi:Rrf2 family transcriptional regulator [Oculatella sp. FACHB-28]|uniref:Rrf2 family transcriptional regulator n=1 Tax=Oculatella sp. FACHB-28 TaxID=2692845 RepID=UPI00168A179D|nr:Rrf2 family transcriptional regulator [Oculatella sp. FACHB-28]MBD2054687.1 Rrf2 family transcriptional regulator [Oculatella sp. FACHB-28]